MFDYNVAVVHGTALERGGGVQVAEELARTFDAPLYFGTCDDSVLNRTADDINCQVLFDGHLADFVNDYSTLRNLYNIYHFQNVSELHSYDVVIQSDNGTEWYVPPEEQILIRYSHSLPALSYQDFPAQGSTFVNRCFGFVSRILRDHTIKLPDSYLANSETTQRQLKKYWDVNADIAYPPVKTDEYYSGNQDSDPFYLSLSRLIEGKKVEEIVTTFNSKLPETSLVVAGSGPKEEQLESLAAENVDVRGWVSEEEKRELLGSCQALILNSGNESFGIVPVEAFASGTPVIGLSDGYTQYQIEDGWNGLLYEPGNLAKAIERFETSGVSATADEIAAFAERYSVEAFRAVVRKAVNTSVERSEITAPNH